MKTHTEIEIKEKFINIWDITYLSNISTSIDKEKIVVHIKSDDDRPLPMKLSYLMSLAEFFDTKNIDEDHYMVNSGCETCGYDSYYDYTFTIKPDEE